VRRLSIRLRYDHFQVFSRQRSLECLGTLLQSVQSGLDGIYQLQSKIFSSKLLFLQTCKLLSQRTVAQHLDPILEVTASEMELEGSKVDSVEDSQKVVQIARCCSSRSSYGSVEVEGVLGRNVSQYVSTDVSHNLAWHTLTYS
jgi:hypothetical protein